MSKKLKKSNEASQPKPFVEHLAELKRRLLYVAGSALVGTLIAYVFEKKLVAALLAPAGNQRFIYTSPIGGVDFLFRVCLYAGIALAIPVIIYNFLRYVEPVVERQSLRFVYSGTVVSAILAAGGLCFGYFVGLPHAMNFLLHQKVNAQIQPLLSVQSYMSFVIRYMLGSALLFQLPLILIFTNRIKPLKPRRLLRFEKWVILGAFVISGLMNPTPRLIDQLYIAGPLIGMYQLSILLIMWINHRPKTKSKAQSELLHPGHQLIAGRPLISDFFVPQREA